MRTTSDAHEFFTVAEVSQKTQTSKRTIWLWINTGRLPAVKLGKHYLVPASGLVALEERARAEATERARAARVPTAGFRPAGGPA